MSMSGSITTTRSGLASGLARCHARTAADGPVLTTTGSDYSAPLSGAAQRTLPVPPPPPASVMHRCRDLQFPPISYSHAIHAATKAYVETTVETSMPPSTNRNEAHLHISADRRLETCSTTTGENFQPTPRMLPATLVRKPAADKSKFTHYCSADHRHWSTTVPPHHSSEGRSAELLREKYVVTKNAGCCPITGSSGEVKVQGCGAATLTTTNCDTYRGHAVRVGDRKSVHHPRLSNIPQGDLCKAEVPCTTSRATYQPPQHTTPGTNYSRSDAVAAILRSSVHFGGTTDNTTAASTRVSERVPGPPLGKEEGTREGDQSIRAERVYRNASFLPHGDMDAGRVRERMSHSTTKSTHKVPPLHSYPDHVDSTSLHTASSVHLGHHHHQPPSSTMTTSYQPLPTHPQRVDPPTRDNIPLDYYPGHLSDSTAASSYRPHIGDLRHILAPNTLKNLKTSHWQLSNALSS